MSKYQNHDRNHLLNVDQLLRCRIQEQTEQDHDLWSSPNRLRRDSTHGFFQYPAMMVPQVQRQLLALLLSVQPGIRSVVDPFVGAGTSLVSAMHHGLDCYGQDINPLAVLTSRARIGPEYTEDIAARVHEVVDVARSDTSESMDVDFPNLLKWFRPDVAIELSRLRRAIQQQEALWARRFLWVTLAETVRLTSNDRTSTYKLHARPAGEIAARNISPIEVFGTLASNNVEDLLDFMATLRVSGYVKHNKYIGNVNVSFQDTKDCIQIPDEVVSQAYDLMITSPPYGDNTSTVPYGQHAYLPLQWIDLSDIDPKVEPTILRSTYEIDYRSLGGRRVPKSLEAEVRDLSDQSQTLAGLISVLRLKPRDRLARVVAFYRDFILALDQIANALRTNAYLVWTMGNRTVGETEVPNDRILDEFLRTRNITYVTQVERKILFKRMPERNGIAPMMRKERILVFRKNQSGNYCE